MLTPLTRRAIAVLAATALLPLAACGSSGSAGDSGTTAAAADTPYEVAVLVGGGSNAYQAAGVAAIKAAAADNDARVKVFDASFDANKQYTQFQSAITSGEYDAILIDPVNGSGIVPLAEQAKAAGIEVGAWNQPIGSDLTTPEPTVDGVTTQVMFPVANHGHVMGTLTKQACAKAKADPCEVAFLYFQKGSPYDTAIVKAFDSVVGDDPSIKVVAGADTQATRQGGLAAAQTILAGHPDADVMIGTSQAVEGAASAVADAKLSHPVYLIGQALTRQGAKMVADGKLFGGSQAMADEEGRLALVQITKALAGKPFEAGIDPGKYLKSRCWDGVTKANVTDCKFAFDG